MNLDYRSETGAKFGKGGAATNLFENGTVFDLYVYLSEFEDNAKLNYHDIDLIWKQEGKKFQKSPEKSVSRNFSIF